MSEDFYKILAKRRTIRDFNEKPIEDKILKRILSAGLMAPSNDHLRDWKFINISDLSQRQYLLNKEEDNLGSEDRVKRIIETMQLKDELQKQMYLDAIPKQEKMLLTASILLIPCYYQPRSLLSPRNLSDLNYFASIWCCIENILIAAAAENIFGVVCIPHNNDSLKRKLHIPSVYEVPCYLALGYPKNDIKLIPQHEKNIENLLANNEWSFLDL